MCQTIAGGQSQIACPQVTTQDTRISVGCGQASRKGKASVKLQTDPGRKARNMKLRPSLWDVWQSLGFPHTICTEEALEGRCSLAWVRGACAENARSSPSKRTKYCGPETRGGFHIHSHERSACSEVKADFATPICPNESEDDVIEGNCTDGCRGCRRC